MNDDAAQAERVGPIELVDECGDRLFAQGGCGGGQIDEITGVRHDRRETADLGRIAERTDLLVGQRLRAPLVGVLGEDLQRFAPVQRRTGDGLGDAAGHRHVRADAHAGRVWRQEAVTVERSDIFAASVIVDCDGRLRHSDRARSVRAVLRELRRRDRGSGGRCPRFIARVTTEVAHRSARMRQRFSEMLQAAEQRRHVQTSREPQGWVARLQDRMMAWVAERIAEQRLLWNLREQTEAVLVHPQDMTFEQVLDARPAPAAARLRAAPAAGSLLDAVSADPVCGAALVPGPNIVAYYFIFRVVGHWLSMRGARQGLDRVTSPAGPARRSPSCAASLSSTWSLAREQRIHDIADGLRLQHLSDVLRARRGQSMPSTSVDLRGQPERTSRVGGILRHEHRRTDLALIVQSASCEAARSRRAPRVPARGRW